MITDLIEEERALDDKRGECWFRIGIVAGIDLIKSLLEKHADGYIGSDLAKAVESAFKISKERSEQADEELKAMAEKLNLKLGKKEEFLN